VLSGLLRSPDDHEELQEISNNGFEMVSSLLEVYPHAARARDMDGQLPIDWGIRNKSSAMFEIVTGLLNVHSNCLRVEGGEATLLADWVLVQQNAKLQELIRCILQHWPDSEETSVDMTPGWPQRQLELLCKHHESHTAAGGVGPCVLQRFIKRLQHCGVPISNEPVSGESITDVLSDAQMQAFFRVLAYEFFVRTRICEYTHTAAGGTAAIAQLDQDAHVAVHHNAEDARANTVMGALATLNKDRIAAGGSSLIGAAEVGGATGRSGGGGGASLDLLRGQLPQNVGGLTRLQSFRRWMLRVAIA